MLVTRGFQGRGRQGANAGRIPPGQYLEEGFPVLTAGPTQRTPLDQWSLSLWRDGRELAGWSWAEFEALPRTELETDIHCVTKWTKLDTHWRGVPSAECRVPSAECRVLSAECRVLSAEC
jgi:DMSO/TMAO reductase YedYZ molybdopterin-dependent catalytic subunit